MVHYCSHPGLPGTFSPWVSDPDMHHGTCVTHVPWCMPGSLTSGFFGSRWRRKSSRHPRRMHNPQFFASGKKSMCSGPESERNISRVQSRTNNPRCSCAILDLQSQLRNWKVFSLWIMTMYDFGPCKLLIYNFVFSFLLDYLKYTHNIRVRLCFVLLRSDKRFHWIGNDFLPFWAGFLH